MEPLAKVLPVITTTSAWERTSSQAGSGRVPSTPLPPRSKMYTCLAFALNTGTKGRMGPTSATRPCGATSITPMRWAASTAYRVAS